MNIKHFSSIHLIITLSAVACGGQDQEQYSPWGIEHGTEDLSDKQDPNHKIEPIDTIPPKAAPQDTLFHHGQFCTLERRWSTGVTKSVKTYNTQGHLVHYLSEQQTDQRPEWKKTRDLAVIYNTDNKPIKLIYFNDDGFNTINNTYKMIYNPDHRLTQCTLNDIHHTALTYNEEGYPQHVQTDRERLSYVYEQNQVKQIRTLTNAPNYKTERHYLFGTQGQLLHITKADIQQNLPSEIVLSASYDERYRIRTRYNATTNTKYHYSYKGDVLEYMRVTDSNDNLIQEHQWIYTDDMQLTKYLTRNKEMSIIRSVTFNHAQDGITSTHHQLDGDNNWVESLTSKHVYDEHGNLLERHLDHNQDGVWEESERYTYECRRDLPTLKPLPTSYANDNVGVHGPTFNCGGRYNQIELTTEKHHDHFRL